MAIRLKYLLIPVLVVLASVAQARREEGSNLDREIGLLRRIINNNVSLEQRDALNRALDRLEMSAGRICQAPNHPPYPGPNPLPNPNLRSCDVEFDPGLRAYRATKDGSPLSNWSYNLNDVLQNIEELQTAGICRPSRDSVCDLEWDSGLRAYRTIRNNLPFQSFQYDLNASLNLIQNLTDKGLCRRVKATRCDLDWDPGLRAYRVSRDGKGASSWNYNQIQTIGLIQQLREAGLCF